MTAAARFRQVDVTRALRAARAAGYPRVRIVLDPGGNIVVDASNDPEPLAPEPSANPLDRLLGDGV